MAFAAKLGSARHASISPAAIIPESVQRKAISFDGLRSISLALSQLSVNASFTADCHVIGGRFNTFEYNTSLHHVYLADPDTWQGAIHASFPIATDDVHPTPHAAAQFISLRAMGNEARLTHRPAEVCHRVAPIDCVKYSKRSSRIWKPLMFASSSGKNVIRTVRRTLDSTPKPSQTMKRGATAILGTSCISISGVGHQAGEHAGRTRQQVRRNPEQLDRRPPQADDA